MSVFYFIYFGIVMGNVVGESYMGGGVRTYISPAQIRKMKRNMKKVPKIQSKAQQYSEKEGILIDKWFDENLQNLDNL